MRSGLGIHSRAPFAANRLINAGCRSSKSYGDSSAIHKTGNQNTVPTQTLMKTNRIKNSRSKNHVIVSGLVTDLGEYFAVETRPGERAPSLIVPAIAVLNRLATQRAGENGTWAQLAVQREAVAYHGYPIDLTAVTGPSQPQARAISDWSYAAIAGKFDKTGCSVAGCPFHNSGDSEPGIFYCALNLSDAIIRAGYSLPSAINVNYCAHAKPRVRNADGMARVVKSKNGGAVDVSGYANRPNWKGIVYFEGGFQNATGHINLWNGTSGVHANYPNATTVWFWRLGA